jgi:hypothetical protein
LLCITDFVQQLLFTWLPGAEAPKLGRRWLLQQLLCSACAQVEGPSSCRQHSPPEQQEPPQQQPVRGEDLPRQNGMCWPLGQTQSKCGTLAIRVETAVRQTNPSWTALLKNLILLLFPSSAISSTLHVLLGRMPRPKVTDLSIRSRLPF